MHIATRPKIGPAGPFLPGLFSVTGLSHRSWSPATTGPPEPSAANYVAVDGPPGPSMAAMDGPLCRKWSPGSKPEKQWL